MDRTELADFLRQRRSRLRPEDVGLTPGPRRRTAGLRREEVAQLTGMSTDYYMRLEQARSPQPSTQLLAALAGALRLDEDQREHLYLLAGHRPPAPAPAGEDVHPGLLLVLEKLWDTPVQVLSDLGDVLAQNQLAEMLFGTVCTVSEHGRNMVWRWFADERVRAAYPPDEHAYYSHMHVADLRAAVTRRGNDAASARLVERLKEASPEFVELWGLHEVSVRRNSRMRVTHPALGPIELDCELLLTPAEDQRLLIFTVPPGSNTGERMRTLIARSAPASDVAGGRKRTGAGTSGRTVKRAGQDTAIAASFSSR
jgi:transcriptional regulator with XRE-family HTH domain